MRRLILLATMLMLLMSMLVVGCGKKEPITLTVLTQQEGPNLAIEVRTTGFRVGKDGHMHLQVDDGPQIMPSMNTYLYRNFPKGKHQIKVEIANPNHEVIGEPAIVEVDFS